MKIHRQFLVNIHVGVYIFDNIKILVPLICDWYSKDGGNIN